MTTPSNIKFSKMHGLGNDFMMIDHSQQAIPIDAQQIRDWADRHTGIGFDQCIIIEASQHADYDFAYRIINADGQEVEQCGNGARCVAEYVALKGLSDKPRLALHTPFDRVESQRVAPGQIAIEFAAPKQIRKEQNCQVGQETIIFDQVQLANPHAVVLVDDIDKAPVMEVGDPMSQHKHFPEGSNIEFVQVMTTEQINVRVRERGVGETQACGTGAMAAMVACFENDLCQSNVTVRLPGGDLQIQWQGKNEPITMTGPAIMVYDGVVALA